MSKPKLTPWYPPEIKPTRKGIYERKGSRNMLGKYRHWNGVFWGGWNATIKGALRNQESPSADQSSHWRGLATDPAEKAKG